MSTDVRWRGSTWRGRQYGVFLEFDGKVKYERLLKDGESASDVVFREKQREDMICRLTGWRCIRIVWADLYQPAASRPPGSARCSVRSRPDRVLVVGSLELVVRCLADVMFRFPRPTGEIPPGAVGGVSKTERVQTGLERFSEPTRAWFAAAFAEPTAAQQGAWDAIGAGRHALVVAPTGSGKTLAAFLWSLDKLLTAPVPEKAKRCRVLYISPLKALGVDVERNLRAPLAGIRHTADRLSPGSAAKLPEIRVGVRSGDTTAQERRRLTSQPPDILITTPESLFLMLTSQARESLRGVDTVIVDEVHAVAGGKRGAHLAVSLERLDALLEKPAQRIGLSATVRPLDEVARFLGGHAPVDIVAPPADKAWDLKVVVPVEDMTAPDGDQVDDATTTPTTAAAARSGRTSRSTSSTSSSSTAPPSSSPTPAASPSG